MTETKKHPFLPVGEGNTLVLKEDKRTQKRGEDNDDTYYDEVAPDGTVVSKFHVYHHMSIYPPFPSSEGWKQYDLNDNVISSGTIVP